MEFTEQQKTIRESLRRGDMNEITTRSGYSRETVRKALKLKTLIGATDAEIEVWNVAVSFLKERQDDAKKAEVRIARIAKTLK